MSGYKLPQDEMVRLTLELSKDQEAAFLRLWHGFLAGKIRVETPAIDFDGKVYREAAKDIFTKEATSPALRKRISEDDKREPVDALTDAEMLHALQAKRFAESVPVGRYSELQGDPNQQAGVEALRRLYEVAQGDSGQCGRIARFLLSLYNGSRFPFDLTDFRSLDDELYDDCMRVLRMDARACKKEVHCYFDNGSARWEQMAEDWSVPDTGRLVNICRDLVKHGLRGSYDSFDKLVQGIEKALKNSTKE